MSSEPIPFNRPTTAPNTMRYLEEAYHSGRLSGDGPFTLKASAALSKLNEGAHVLLTTSCTHALEMSALLLGIGPGDEVIMPAFTFVSTANAFVLRGATIMFADIDPNTMNIDPAHVEQLTTDRTRAIVPVHYAGIGCSMERLMPFAASHGIAVVEDNAHGLFGSYAGRPLGTFGQMSTLSFHETKNLSSGEGGALVINDLSVLERAEIIREKGTNRSRFFRGQVDKYTWVDVGSSYLPSEFVAAALAAQLDDAESIQARRKQIWTGYHTGLQQWAHSTGVQQPAVPAAASPAWHLYYLLMPDLESRTRFIDHLRAQQVHAVFHYQALNISPMGMRFPRTDCPVTESVSDRLVRLPLFSDMDGTQLQRVLDAIHSFQV